MRVQSEAGFRVSAVAAVQSAVEALPKGRWLLAVSGGRDSMVLLDAFGERRAREIAAVATFDHGTGAAARDAAELVERSAVVREIPVVSGSASASLARTEAAWRTARWKFLAAWAEELNATVVTAHTRDDQVETVFIRLLRGSGVRGLAGMRVAQSPEARPRIERPLLDVPRRDIAVYADARAVRWAEDPTNVSRAFLRNRVRHDLLPALETAQPGFHAWCASLGERAAAWRAAMDALVERSFAPSLTPDGSVVVRASAVATLRAGEWAVVWPVIAARAGVMVDWRGLERASAWAPAAKVGSEIPLAGGARISRTAATFVLHPPAGARGAGPGTTLGSDDYILNE